MAASMRNNTDEESNFIKQGAEAKLYKADFYGKASMVKERFSKKYRHPTLDKSLTFQRLKAEVRAVNKCRNLGITVPTIYFVDSTANSFYMEDIVNASTIKEYIYSTQKEAPDSAIQKLTPLAKKIGQIIGKMHEGKVIHGDLTTSNMLIRGNPEDLDVVLIDFGLSFSEGLPEDKGVDLYVFERALLSTHPNTEPLFESVLQAYKTVNGKQADDAISKYEEVKLRGRKRTMVG